MSHLAAFGKRSYNPRKVARQPVSLAASLYGFACSRSVIISDLSPNGARLHGRDLPAPGQDAFLVVGSVDTIGKVAWRFGDQCGVVLDEPIAPATIVKMKSEAEWQSVAGWYR